MKEFKKNSIIKFQMKEMSKSDLKNYKSFSSQKTL